MSKKIYINPGHSNSDPGAVGYEVERELNVKVSNYMNEHLKANYDCETKLTSGAVGDLNKICEEANAWGADLTVSNHFNAGEGDGYEALVYNQKRLDLGKVFEKHVKAAGQNSRGVKYRTDLAILRNTNMPAILNEGAFVDNLTDIKDWNEDAELKKLGIAYAEATAEYLKLNKKETISNTVENKPSTKPVSKSYKVKVTAGALNIRDGAGTNYKVNGVIRDKGVYTIVETVGNFGKLKSGAGWICLDYTQKI